MPKHSYEYNVRNMLIKRGLAPKYDHAGIYCIKIGNEIVYIGKSTNMLQRISQHYVGIKKQDELKYQLMAEIQSRGYSIDFDVLYNAEEQSFAAIEEEIGAKERDFIRLCQPILNTQIPEEDNWRKFKNNQIDPQKILSKFPPKNTR